MFINKHPDQIEKEELLKYLETEQSLTLVLTEGRELVIDKFEVVGTKGGAAVRVVFLEHNSEGHFEVFHSELFPLSKMERAVEYFIARAQSENPATASAGQLGFQSYSMFEIREELMRLEREKN